MSARQSVTRRQFLRLAGGALAGASLAACSPVAPGVSAPPGAAQPAAAPVEIVYAFHDPADYRTAAVATFREASPNMRITLQQIPDEFPTKIFTMAAAGTLPDVVRVWEPHVLDFGRAGQVIDLQPYIDGQADFDVDDFIPSFYNFSVIGGRRYGIADGWNGHLTFYNKDLFDAAGAAYPTDEWSWDDYVATARTISRPDEKIWGSDGLFIGWLHWSYKLVWQNGGQVYNADYTACLLDSPEAIEGLQYWADLLQEAEIMPSPAQAEGLGDMFQIGRAAMQRVGTWVIGALAEGSFQWDMVAEPQQRQKRTLLHTAFNVIPRTTKNQDAAWEWLNFIVGPVGMLQYVTANATPGTRRSVNTQQPWARQGVDARWEIVPQAGEYGFLVPAPPNVGEVEKLQSDAIQAIFLGKMSAAESLMDVAPKVTALLQQEA